uniref:Putative secreted protein n=1 Tax=Ixodes ricinus TaxID=34613 RepID=A0A6B0U1K3_IXORI
MSERKHCSFALALPVCGPETAVLAYQMTLTHMHSMVYTTYTMLYTTYASANAQCLHLLLGRVVLSVYLHL